MCSSYSGIVTRKHYHRIFGKSELYGTKSQILKNLLVASLLLPTSTRESTGRIKSERQGTSRKNSDNISNSYFFNYPRY